MNSSDLSTTRKSRRSAVGGGEDGTAAANASAMSTPKASAAAAAADELSAVPKHSAENMAKRRKRNPQESAKYLNLIKPREVGYSDTLGLGNGQKVSL